MNAPCCGTPRPPTFVRTHWRGHQYECSVCATPLLHAHGHTTILRSVTA